MKVAIIGAGNVGKALGTSMTRAGHEVTISASTPESAEAAARVIGASPADSAADAVKDASIIILAIPYQAGGSVAAEIADRVSGRTIIDVTNPIRPDFSGLATDTSAAEELQIQLPDAHVVKAFNTLFARFRRTRQRPRRRSTATSPVTMRTPSARSCRCSSRSA